MRGGVFKTVVCNLSVNSLLSYNSITNAVYHLICKLQKLPTYTSAHQFTNLLKSYVSQSGSHPRTIMSVKYEFKNLH